VPGDLKFAPVLHGPMQLLTGTVVQLIICNFCSRDAKFLNQFSQNDFIVILTLCFHDNSIIVNSLILLTLLKTEASILALEGNLS